MLLFIAHKPYQFFAAAVNANTNIDTLETAVILLLYGAVNDDCILRTAAVYAKQ